MDDNKEAYSGEQEKHLMDYVNVVMQRRFIFIVSVSIILLGTIIYTYRIKPVYEAYTTLHIGGDKPSPGMALFMGGASNPIGTEIEILKSRTIAEEVAKRLRLKLSVSNRTPGLDFKLSEFSPADNDKRSSYRIEVTGVDSYQVLDKAGIVVGKGQAGKLMKGEGIVLLLDDIKGPAGASFILTYKPEQVAAGEIMGNMRVVEVGTRTDIVRMSYLSTDPSLARAVANTLAEVYIDQDIAYKMLQTSNTLSFVGEQLGNVRAEIDKAEKNLQDFKAHAGTVQLDAGAQELLQGLSEAEKAKREISLQNMQRKQAEYAYSVAKDNDKKGSSELLGMKLRSTDPLLLSRLAELDDQRKLLRSELTDNHPAVLSIQAQINSYEHDLKQMPQLEQELIRRTRDSKVSSEMYTFLLQKHEEAKIAKAAATSNIRIIDSAILPVLPVMPNKQRNIMMGFLAALMVGLGLVFFIDYLDDTIKDAETAKRVFGTSMLAIIPYISRDETSNGTNGQQEDKKQSLITYLSPKAQASEAFRSLRTAIHFSAVKRQRQILMITSSFPGEGKSTIVANLAVCLAQTGARVALLDCDLRRPSIHEIFGFKKTPGLSEVLAGDAGLDAVCHQTPIEGLYAFCAGTIPPNPSELLGSEQMAKMLETLKDTYDYVLLDAPPILAVTDAPLLTTSSHMVILVVEGGKVPVKAAQRVRDVLTDLKAPLAGLVLNDKSSSSGKGYYGYYRYGYSRYGYYYTPEYYGEDEARKKKPWLKRLVSGIMPGRKK